MNKMNKEQWDRIEAQQSGRKPKRSYPTHECIKCGKLIRENGYSGGSGNLKRHMKGCAK
jgi:hypothetical protein